MSETDKLSSEDMARAYLDLWQEQWSVFAADPNWQKRIIDNMMQMENFFGKMPKGSHADDTRAGQGKQSQTGQSEAASSSSGDSAALLDEFSRRIAILEKRLARLENKNIGHKDDGQTGGSAP